VIFLGAFQNFPDDDSAVRANLEAFAAAKTVSMQMAGAGGFFITVQDTGGDFGLTGRHESRSAYAAGVSGLVKTMVREWPKASVKAIDLSSTGRSSAVLARVLAEEIATGGADIEVGLGADGRRSTVEVAECSSGMSGTRGWVDSQSIVIASGGARGVTAAALIALARETRCRIVLLGRSSLPEEPEFCRGLKDVDALNAEFANRLRQRGHTPEPKDLDRSVREILQAREIRTTIAALQSAGSEMLYCPVDIRDERAVCQTLEDIRRRWGKPGGIVHAAGVLADKSIAEKTTEQFNFVFQTKVAGLRNLLKATADDPIRFIGLFSSVAARAGNEGQCDYAMANEVLNKVASAEAKRRGGDCLVKSFNWGPWDGGMVTPSLKSRFERKGVTLIPLEEGAKAFVDEILWGNPAAVEVVLGDDPRAFSGTAEMGVERTFEIKVDVHRYPEIADHSIDGMPVVPVVQVLSWLLSAARYFNISDSPVACKDIKIFRGVRLPAFFDTGHVLRLRCRRNSRTALFCEVRNEDDVLHYSGTVEWGVDQPVAPAVLEESGGGKWAWSAEEAYTKCLFHGPRFHSLKSLSEYSPTGASAILDMPAGQRNVAVLDGGLQLLVLWVMKQKGRNSLPTEIGRFISCRGDEPIEHWSNVHCCVRITHDSTNHVEADLSFLTETGECIGEFRSVSVHLRNGSGTALME
jgi:NAD(P)-dependent dehydrogenase (short-subunit alcohol dehydrogenase family)